MEITLSPKQLLAVAAATTTSDNLLISACAGGAKTTTMCAIARALGPGTLIVPLAFNTEASIQLGAKMPYFVQRKPNGKDCHTFHSFCYDALGRHLGRKPKPDANRCKWMLKELVPDWKTRRDIEDGVLTLVSRFKSTTLDITEENLATVADRFDLDIGTSSLDLSHKVLRQCEEDKAPKSIDFDDMLWLAHRWKITLPAVSVVLLDEAQDTNSVQRALLDMALNKLLHQGRLIAVGDPHQSIYGFRGADHDAMDALQRDFNMTPLALSVSYRCSQAVVAEAQKYL